MAGERGQMTVGRGQISDVRMQRTDIRGQKTDDRSQNIERFGIRNVEGEKIRFGIRFVDFVKRSNTKVANALVIEF